ncbi:hypothetical protein BFL43_04325 [Williamsia sp. 1135]|nr:hypothetical protein BFL43_04325 [Williamsia sp. 1135]
MGPEPQETVLIIVPGTGTRPASTTNGQSGYFERSLNAYGREDKPCRRCGAAMRREQFMNRSSFSGPKCQVRPRF